MSALLRALFLWLSRQRGVGAAFERLPLSDRLLRRFVAGRSHAEAVETGRSLVERGYGVTFSLLGEEVDDPQAAAAAAQEYRDLIEHIGQAGIAASSKVAVKPTLLGLACGFETAQANLTRVLEAARWLNVGVEIDMERSDTVDDTLALFRGAAADNPSLMVAIQAYLKRTPADVAALIDAGIARVRLVKGAYEEPPTAAHQSMPVIVKAYHDLLRTLLEPQSIARGTVVAVATHDLPLLAGARTRTFRKRTPDDRWEVQMLLGVKPSQQERLRREGYPMRVYLPYGEHWYPYFLRRLAERPANLVFALRSLFSR